MGSNHEFYLRRILMIRTYEHIESRLASDEGGKIQWPKVVTLCQTNAAKVRWARISLASAERRLKLIFHCETRDFWNEYRCLIEYVDFTDMVYSWAHFHFSLILTISVKTSSFVDIVNFIRYEWFWPIANFVHICEFGRFLLMFSILQIFVNPVDFCVIAVENRSFLNVHFSPSVNLFYKSCQFCQSCLFFVCPLFSSVDFCKSCQSLTIILSKKVPKIVNELLEICDKCATFLILKQYRWSQTTFFAPAHIQYGLNWTPTLSEIR